METVSTFSLFPAPGQQCLPGRSLCTCLAPWICSCYPGAHPGLPGPGGQWGLCSRSHKTVTDRQLLTGYHPRLRKRNQSEMPTSQSFPKNSLFEYLKSWCLRVWLSISRPSGTPEASHVSPSGHWRVCLTLSSWEPRRRNKEGNMENHKGMRANQGLRPREMIRFTTDKKPPSRLREVGFL